MKVVFSHLAPVHAQPLCWATTSVVPEPSNQSILQPISQMRTSGGS